MEHHPQPHGHRLPGLPVHSWRFARRRSVYGDSEERGEWEAGSPAKENRKDKKKKDKKVAKGKGPEIPDGWLKTDTEWMPAESNETVYAIPGRWKDIYNQAEKNLKVLHAGVKLGTDKGKGLIPDQALALSTMLNKDHFPQVELSYDDAIRYLRKEL